MKTSMYVDKRFYQITVSDDFTERKALLTRFKGQSKWSVRGRMHDDDGMFKIELGTMTKKNALDVAKSFVNCGF